MLPEVLNILKQGFARILQSPTRLRLPLPMERFNAEQEEALEKLKEILGRDDLNWRNLPDAIESALGAPSIRG